MPQTEPPFDPLDFIRAQAWTFAKTRPQNPHEYIVRRHVSAAAAFDAMVRHIRENGRERAWGRKRYIVWYAPDGYHYWTMGWPVAETTIINRAVSAHQDQTTDAQRWMPYSSPDGFKPEGVPAESVP